MDINRYLIPNLPTSQSILEDLSDPDIIKNYHRSKTTDGDVVQDAHTCHTYFKGLEEDLTEHSRLNSKLADLNKKLVENIENMKSH